MMLFTLSRIDTELILNKSITAVTGQQEQSMSETVHYKGKLTPTNKTLAEYDPLAVDIHDIEGYQSAVEVNGYIYTVEKSDVDQEDDIYTAELNNDGSIEFEVKYYNGGCGFNEAIETAIEVINK